MSIASRARDKARNSQRVDDNYETRPRPPSSFIRQGDGWRRRDPKPVKHVYGTRWPTPKAKLNAVTVTEDEVTQ